MRQRQQKILEHVGQVGIVSLAELAQMFSVSEFTIRRDIEYLDRSRLLVKVKGGAQRLETVAQLPEVSLRHRMKINTSEKERIAAKALELVLPGDTIFLDGSSTIACLARAIAQNCHNITVVTNSVLVALELSESPDIRLIGLGGIFDRETLSYVGFDPDAPAEALESFYVDKAFFSSAGFVPKEGTFENAAFNRTTKRLAAQRAAKVYLLIDASKFGKRALARVLDTSQIDTVITDKMPNERDGRQLQQCRINLVTAEGGNNIASDGLT